MCQDGAGREIVCRESKSLQDRIQRLLGTEDPLDGVNVVAELAVAEKVKYGNGYWQLEGEEKEASSVPL